MTVSTRRYVRHGVATKKLLCDIRIELPNGEVYRERVVSPVSGGKTATRKWGEERERTVMALYKEGLDLVGIWRHLRGEDVVQPPPELTVEVAINEWLKQREDKYVPGHAQEKQRLHDYVLPVIGALKVAEVRPRHAYQLIEAMARIPSKRGGVLAPRTVRSAYFTTRQVFQHLVLQEVIPGNPMTVEKGDRSPLPRVKDKIPGWRQTAVFTASEVETLISDERIPVHRRIAYAVEFLTGLRTGQVSALKWGDYDTSMQPLGKITSAVSYNSARKVVKETKTGAVHEVPVHPTLHRLLVAWKLSGWEQWIGREPKEDDLVIPTKRGTHRNVRKALARFHDDLDRLELRRRRHYDSRATFITLCLNGGASKDILQSITHPRPRDAFDLYRRESWEARCAAVSCLRVSLREGKVVTFPGVGGRLAADVEVSG